jgi:transcription initiation factor TFIIIB Brf1 subunit/transcription initiation factor TFIIB
MPRVTGATLTRQMIGRIEQFLAGDKSIQIPEAAMKRYREKLGLTEDTLEEAIEMTQ